MKEELIHEVHNLSYSDYVDQEIKCNLSLRTNLGVNMELWLNTNGQVIGLEYYRMINPKEQTTKEKEGQP